jgi:hypothetical protein
VAGQPTAVVARRRPAPHAAVRAAVFAKRAVWLAVCHAEGHGEGAVTPEHLLYGVLRDLDDPYGAQLGRRGRKHLTQLGWTIGAVNPAGALLQAHGIDPSQLRAELDGTP